MGAGELISDYSNEGLPFVLLLNGWVSIERQRAICDRSVASLETASVVDRQEKESIAYHPGIVLESEKVMPELNCLAIHVLF